MKGKIAVYVGPTAFGLGTKPIKNPDPDRIVFLPPVKRGDLEMLDPAFTTILIVDGYFHSVPAVGHAEIRDALRRAEIIGCSSMGAIRAYEMRGLGMRGFGRIYEMFLEHEDFTDDEVALLHAPEPLYFPLSEPLVHLRELTRQLIEKRLLGANDGRSIVAELREMYFGNRTLETYTGLLGQRLTEEEVNFAMGWLPHSRLKCFDFMAALSALAEHQ